MPRPTDVGSVGEEIYAAIEPLTYADEENDWALLVFCGGLGLPSQQINDLVSDTEDRPGWANLLDVEECPEPYLPHLGQYVGVRVPTAATEEEARNLIRDHNGFQRGTLAALIAAVQETLTGTKTVQVTERNEDPYYIAVQTYTSETPDEAVTLAAILTQKPAGLVLTFTVADSDIIDVLDGTIDELSGTIDAL